MKNWLEKQKTTNLLLLVIALLLGIHLLVNLPIMPVAGAQLVKTKPEEFWKSMDDHLETIDKNISSINTNISIIESCVVSTPIGGKAISTRETNTR